MLTDQRIPWAYIARRHYVSLLCILIFALGATLLEHWVSFDLPRLTAPISMVGVAVGAFLNFRNNAAYDRYWEGRKALGTVVTTARTFSRQVITQLEAPTPELREHVVARQRIMVHAIIAYAHSLRCALRGEDPWPTIAPLLPKSELVALHTQSNLPDAIVRLLGRLSTDAARQGWLTEQRLWAMDRSLAEFTAAQGACERIHSTALPASYSQITNRILQVYCLVFPFGLAEDLHIYTIAVSYAVGFMFVLLDGIGIELEHPFGSGPLQLPLSALTTTIEINLRQALGEQNAPSPALPVHGILI